MWVQVTAPIRNSLAARLPRRKCFYFDHRFWIAFWAISLCRRSGVNFSARACPPALLRLACTKLDGSGVAVILLTILDLSGGDVAYQFGESNRVTRTLLAGFGHDNIIAWLATERIWPSRLVDFKLTHYRILAATKAKMSS